MRGFRRLRVVVSTLIGAALIGSTAAAQTPSVQTVLAVHWRSEDFPTTVETEAGIREWLRSDTGGAVDYFAEYLESDRFPPEQASIGLRDYIQRKYAGRRIDVVLAVSDTSLEFVRRFREDLFPSAAIVYLGFMTPAPDLPGDGDGITGVVLGAGFRATLELALAMHPAAERVHVIANRSDGRLDETVQMELGDLAQKIPISYLSDLPMPQLLAAVAAIPERDLILFVRHSQEAPGSVVLPTEFARMVAETSRAPVYGVSEAYLGTGVVGGAVYHRRELGVRIGRIAREILDGRDPRNIPFERAGLVPSFDWRQLQRWGIDSSKLPSGSRILFEQPGIWEQYRWHVMAIVSVIAVQGLLIGLMIAQRRRRRDTEARSNAILSAIPDMMFLLTRDGVYVDFHTPDASLLLAEPSRFLGRRMRDVLPPQVAELFESRFAQLTPGDAPMLVEYALKMPGGERHYEARVVPSHGDQVLTVVRDITERKQAERTLHDTQVELDRVSRLTALGEFAVSMAHELGQPLTAIIANTRASLSSLAADSPDLNDVRDALTEVVDAGERASQVLHRNRELFRDHAVQMSPVAIDDVIRDVAVLARGRLQASDVTLVTSLGAEVPPVNGDRIELQQVLLNLIVNGIDAMENTEPGLRRLEITTSLAVTGDVQVAVRDNGMGLGHADVARIFTLSYTTKAGGSGVGLAISRSIVEAHGGRLCADQNSDGGATFSFTIPALISMSDVVASQLTSEVLH